MSNQIQPTGAEEDEYQVTVAPLLEPPQAENPVGGNWEQLAPIAPNAKNEADPDASAGEWSQDQVELELKKLNKLPPSPKAHEDDPPTKKENDPDKKAQDPVSMHVDIPEREQLVATGGGNFPPPLTAKTPRTRKTMAKKAAALAKLERLGGGKKPIWAIRMADISQLGIGIRIYFMFTYFLGVCFLAMFVLSAPAMLVNYLGHGIPDNLVDPLSLALVSLGNQGVSDDFKAIKDNCLPRGSIDCNGTIVYTPLESIGLKLHATTVSWVITFSDMAYSLGFLIGVLVFYSQVTQAIEEYQTENLTPAKYTVFVRGLPRDATKKEICEHFNNLYDLTKPEERNEIWFGCCFGRRRKVIKHVKSGAGGAGAAAVVDISTINANGSLVPNASTVTNLDHLMGTMEYNQAGELYLNKWIAEVSVAHPTGGLLRTFLSMEKMTKALKETQELVGILESEPKPDKFAIQTAKKKIELLQTQLAKKTSKMGQLKDAARAAAEDFSRQTTTNLTAPIAGAAETSAPTGTVSPASTSPAPAKPKAKPGTVLNLNACECAFVVFNHLESRRRCLVDYRKSDHSLTRFFQPKILRFRNKFALKVVAAPEPSDIMWENLEVTPKSRLIRRGITTFLTFLLLLLSCAFISTAQSAQKTFNSKLPPPGLCTDYLPAVFYGTTAFDDASALGWVLDWNFNAQCPATPSGEPQYYVAYTNGILNPINITEPPIGVDFTPVRCTDPCVSQKSETRCNTIGCWDGVAQEEQACTNYTANHLIYCMCTGKLENYPSLMEGAKRLYLNVPPCREFMESFLMTKTFILVAAGVVVFVNIVLKAILRAFAEFEKPSSESAKATTIVSKMFAAQFLNTAVIVLVVNAALGLGEVPLLKELFKGTYADFDRNWYPTVGIGITMTMLINAFVPQITLFVQTYILFPLTRGIQKRYIRSQDKMNELYSGPNFDISLRYPLVLNSLFVTMAFAGGSPVLLGIASLTCFAMHYMDKLSLMKLYSVRTAYDEQLGELVLSLLPWSLVLHLAVSVWSYGNISLLKAQLLDINWIVKTFKLTAVVNSKGEVDANAVFNQLELKADKISLLGQALTKVVRWNVIPVLLFLVLLVLALFLSTLWFQVLYPLWQRTIGLLLSVLWAKFKLFVAKICCCCGCGGRKGAKSVSKIAPGLAPAGAVEKKAEAPPQEAKANEKKVEASPQEAKANEKKAEASPQDAKANEQPLANAPAPGGTGGDTKQNGGIKDPKATAGIAPSATSPKHAAKPRKLSAQWRNQGPRVLPQFTDYFRKSVPPFFKPDTALGFELNASGELIRKWVEETERNGVQRAKGEQMRTWEAIGGAVKSYAIDANPRYRYAVQEIANSTKRMQAKAIEETKTKAATTPRSSTTPSKKDSPDKRNSSKGNKSPRKEKQA